MGPSILVLPAGASGETGDSLGLFAVKRGGLILALIALAGWTVPVLFRQVARRRDLELFLQTVLGAF